MSKARELVIILLMGACIGFVGIATWAGVETARAIRQVRIIVESPGAHTALQHIAAVAANADRTSTRLAGMSQDAQDWFHRFTAPVGKVKSFLEGALKAVFGGGLIHF